MYTHIYIFPFSSSFHPPTVITWFLSMKMGIVVERKEKGIRRRVKRKKEEMDRSSIQIARGIFFKALSADPLCAATALSWIGIIIITVKGANETIEYIVCTRDKFNAFGTVRNEIQARCCIGKFILLLAKYRVGIISLCSRVLCSVSLSFFLLFLFFCPSGFRREFIFIWIQEIVGLRG